MNILMIIPLKNANLYLMCQTHFHCYSKRPGLDRIDNEYRIILGMRRRINYALTRVKIVYVHFPIYETMMEISTKETFEWTVRHDRTYIIWFLTRHNAPINDDLKTILSLQFRVPHAWSTPCWRCHIVSETQFQIHMNVVSPPSGLGAVCDLNVKLSIGYWPQSPGHLSALKIPYRHRSKGLPSQLSSFISHHKL